MAVIRCKMCGGDLVLTPGQTVAGCEYCGSRQTVPIADSDTKMLLFERADRLRRNCEFDKAAGLYEAILSEFRREPEAYWGLVLCKYGIEYVDDPATGKKIPTCHRSSFHSIFEDTDFEQALENADEVALRVYREEAKQIERTREGILAVSASEKPYDIFICYKETDSAGSRSVDSLLAQSIYEALVENGYRVFFSRITLENKLGQAYEPYIFAALNSARIMLAVGTCYEHYNAVWVKNEWSRYLKIISQDKNKYLIPCYRNIDPYDIPREFAHLQGQDMGKVGAMADLLRGIEKLLPKQTRSVRSQTEQVSNSSKVEPLLTRAMLFLEDRDWDSANKYCEKVLDMEPKNGEAYFCKLMAEWKVSREEELCKRGNVLLNSPNYQKAMRFGEAELRRKLENIRKEVETREQTAQQEAQRKLRHYQEKQTQRRERARKKAKKTGRLLGLGLACALVGTVLLILLNTLTKQSSEGLDTVQHTLPADTTSLVQNETVVEVTVDPWANAYADAETLLAEGETAKAAIAFGKLAGYRDAWERSRELWNRIYKKDSIYRINGTFYGLKTDGSIVLAGEDTFGITGKPDWKNTIQLAGGNHWHNGSSCILGLLPDGTVISEGDNYGGQCDVSAWTNIVQLWHSGRQLSISFQSDSGENTNYMGNTFALRADGTVLVAGTIKDFVNVSDWEDIIDLEYSVDINYMNGTINSAYIVGVQSDGTLLITGNNIPQLLEEVKDWTGIVDLEISSTIITGLRADGTVQVAFDETWEYYRNHPDMHEAIREWENVETLLDPGSAIAKDGKYLSRNSVELSHIYNDPRIAMLAKWDNIASVVENEDIALKTDGTVMVAAFGDNPASRVQDWTDVVDVYGNLNNYGGHTIGVRKDGSVLAVGDTKYIEQVATWTDIKIPNP